MFDKIGVVRDSFMDYSFFAITSRPYIGTGFHNSKGGNTYEV